MNLFLCVSCENGEDASKKIDFKGITERNENATLQSRDTTDWRLDDEWNETEHTLFEETAEKPCNSVTDSFFILAYPNPCGSVLRIDLYKPDTMRLAYRIVDSNLDILMARDSVYSNSFVINANSLGGSNDIVRMYYKLIDRNCELKGHGDIKLE